MLARTFVPSTAQRLAGQETIRQSMYERQSHQPTPKFHGLLAVGHPSMNSTQMATYFVPFQHCSLQELLTL